jgi:XTP/dITP diphosphohydrolase
VRLVECSPARPQRADSIVAGCSSWSWQVCRCFVSSGLYRQAGFSDHAGDMTTLLFATRNAHKVAEIRAILGEAFRYMTLKDFPQSPAVVEDAETFAGNATKKAVELARWVAIARDSQFTIHDSQGFVLADDSGLEVDALNGAPGVHSARFAALDSSVQGNSSTADNNAKLLRLLANLPLGKRTARFRCVIALTPIIRDKVESASPVCYADDFELQTQLFDGTCEGRILFEARGQGGFGYDPLFVPEGFEQTFAELGEEIKNCLSHRARALAKLKERLLQLSGSSRAKI